MTYSTRMNTMWGLVATAVVQSTTDNNTSAAAVFFIASMPVVITAMVSVVWLTPPNYPGSLGTRK